MIDSLYGRYFQKSRSFLFPALGIKKASEFFPSGTYICLEGKYDPDDMKLLCSYKIVVSDEFRDFEEKMLISNPLYTETIHIQGYNIYVFDFQIYKNDWFNFLLGKYSKLSTVLKRAIKNYYGENSTEYKYIETYLYPEKFFDVYATLLDVDAGELKKIGELCDVWSDEKETLKIPVEVLENIKKDV